LKAMARWVWDLRSRCAPLIYLALMMVAAPIGIHADELTKHFDIEARPLAEALMAYGAQTGAIVLASSELTMGKTSRRVTGQLTPQEALTRMLRGTGLKFETNANGTILIVRELPTR
jgi:hypothetical protein